MGFSLGRTISSFADTFLGGDRFGDQGDELSHGAEGALKRLAQVSEDQFKFFRDEALKYSDFVYGSPLYVELEKQAAFAATPEGQAAEAAKYRAEGQHAQAQSQQALRRRNAALGIDPSSGAGQATQRGAQVAGAQGIARLGNAGRDAAVNKAVGIGTNLAQVRSATVSPSGMAAGVQGLSNVAQGLGNLAGQQYQREAGRENRLTSTLNTLLGNEGGMVGEEDSEMRAEGMGGPVADAASRSAETDDRIPAALSADEYVATAEATKYHGTWLYDWLEEAARKGVPGIPQFMNKVQPGTVPRRVAGQSPQPPQGGEGERMGAAEGGWAGLGKRLFNSRSPSSSFRPSSSWGKRISSSTPGSQIFNKVSRFFRRAGRNLDRNITQIHNQGLGSWLKKRVGAAEGGGIPTLTAEQVFYGLYPGAAPAPTTGALPTPQPGPGGLEYRPERGGRGGFRDHLGLPRRQLGYLAEGIGLSPSTGARKRGAEVLAELQNREQVAAEAFGPQALPPIPVG